jgi:L-ascorbate metabolism protein UlaG (beta-lactamase superfamily)
LPEIDLVLVSHNHYDHLDLSTLKRLHERFAPRFLVAFGDKQLLESEGIDRVAEFDWWQGIDIDANTRVTFTPTQHFSSRSLWDRDKSLWGSYMIERGPHRIYFGGDAGYSSHYQSIRERIGAPTLAFLPIGAYEPRWFMKPMHMNPEEAVQAHRDLAAKRSIAIHFRCFQLTAEAMDQPVIDLKSALQAASLAEQDFVVLQEGRTEIFDL